MARKTIAMLILLFTVSSLLAQKSILKAGLIARNIGIQYERSLTPHISLSGQFGYDGLYVTNEDDVEARINGIGFYIDGRYYFLSNEDVMEGFYMGPYYYWSNMKNGMNWEATISSIGLTAGYQWIFNSRFTLNLSGGVGTLNIDSNITGGDFLYFSDEFSVHFGLSLGYNF